MAKKKRKAKPYDKLDDIQRSELFGVYCDHDGDIDKTYKALRRKATKTTLKALEEDFNWPSMYQTVSNKFLKGAIDQAVERKKETLKFLHDAKVRAHNAIVGDKKNKIAPILAKTQGEAIDSLVRVIEKESELVGDAPEDFDEDATIGLLKMVLERYFSERGSLEDAKQDPTARATALGISVDVGTRKN